MSILTLIKLIIFDKNDDQFDKNKDQLDKNKDQLDKNDDQFDKNDDQFDKNDVRIIDTRRDLYNITLEQALWIEIEKVRR